MSCKKFPTGNPLRHGAFFVGTKDNPETGKKEMVYLSDDEMSTHLCVLGSTGCGKTSTAIASMVCQAIVSGAPVIFVDLKWDEEIFKLAWYTACMCGRAGRPGDLLGDFRMLQPAALETPTGFAGEIGTNSYNPLAGYSGAINLLAALTRASRGKAKDGTDFWPDVQENALSTAGRAALSTGKVFGPNDLYACMEHPRALSELIKQCVDEEAKLELLKWQEKLDSSDHKFSERLEGTKLFLKKLGTGPLGKILNTCQSDISVKDVYQRNQILWVSLPMLKLGVLAETIGKLLMSDVLDLCGDIQLKVQQDKRKPWYMFVDEAHGFIFPDINLIFAQGRSSGLRSVWALQAPSQIELKDSAPMMSEIMNNSKTKMIGTLKDPDNADRLAKEGGENDFARSINIAGYSVKDAHNYIISPTELQQMPRFKCALIRENGAVERITWTGLPSREVKLGENCPRPKFTPNLSRSGGLRLFEEAVAARI